MHRAAYVYMVVLASGFSSLGIEIAASRLLNSYFGSSQIVWATLIGLMLVYLTAGYYLGGRLADRYPHVSDLFRLMAWAGLFVGLVPFAARPILTYGQRGLEEYRANLLLGSFLSVLVLLAVPVVLLGCISPFATRVAMRDVGTAGNVSGRIYAASTVGSIGGTFVPALVLIPALGTSYTFLLLSALLLLVAVYGLIMARKLAPLVAAMPVAIALITLKFPPHTVKSVPGMIYEDESPYNYIQVVEDEDTGSRYLYLNEGQGVHSVYDPDSVLTHSVWDLFLVVPYFNDPPFEPEQVRSMCLIGLAAGTVARQYTEIYGPVAIDGVEIDPGIIRVGRRYFSMNQPNLNAVAQDGRYFLASSSRRYDVIAIDAYRPPYIPPHLTTREFFQETLAHLSEKGVVAINVGRTVSDDSLVKCLAITMKAVFPHVYVIELPMFSAGLSNSIVVGTPGQTSLANFYRNTEMLEQPELRSVVQQVYDHVWEFEGEGTAFTDDRAPIEQIVHRMMIGFIERPVTGE